MQWRNAVLPVQERGFVLQHGDELNIRIDPADAHLFDEATGKRL